MLPVVSFPLYSVIHCYLSTVIEYMFIMRQWIQKIKGALMRAISPSAIVWFLHFKFQR
jgi:hypothetical protein